MSIFSHNSRFFGKKSPRAFTLVELLAVTVIITIVTMTMLLRQSTFDSSTVLRSTAYSLALSIRQAQVYGVSVLGSSNAGNVSFAPGYGISFSRTSAQSYILFADFNNSGMYDTGEAVKVFTLSNGYTVSEACAIASNGNKSCTGSHDTAGTYTLDSVNIVFRRPNPDAVFNANAGYVSAWVQIKSPNGTARSISITAPGQISVQAPGTLP